MAGAPARARGAAAPRGFAEDTFEVPRDPEGRLDAQAAIARIADTINQEDLALLFRRYVLRETGRQLADESTKRPAAVRMRLMRLRAAVSALSRALIASTEEIVPAGEGSAGLILMTRARGSQ
jgi:hypothetical protein